MVERVFLDFFELFWRKILPQIFIFILITIFTFIYKKSQAAHKENPNQEFIYCWNLKGLIYMFGFEALEKEIYFKN